MYISSLKNVEIFTRVLIVLKKNYFIFFIDCICTNVIEVIINLINTFQNTQT